MKEFIVALRGIRSKFGSLGEDLAKKHKLSVQEPPLEAFPIGFNYSTMALELTSQYDAAWKVHLWSTEEQAAKARKSNSLRLMMLSKTVFAWSLSGIEYSAKRAIERYPAVLATKRAVRNLYLGEVIKLSADAGLIDAAKRPLWFGVKTIRNKVVHNNGYGEGDQTWVFSKDLTVTMEDGKMIEGTIMTFPMLLDWIVAEYADWCDRFLVKAKPSS